MFNEIFDKMHLPRIKKEICIQKDIIKYCKSCGFEIDPLCRFVYTEEFFIIRDNEKIVYYKNNILYRN